MQKLSILLAITFPLISAIVTIENKTGKPLKIDFRGYRWAQQRYVLADKMMKIDTQAHSIRTIRYYVSEPYKDMDAYTYYRVIAHVPADNLIAKMSIYPGGIITSENINHDMHGMRLRLGYFIPSDMDCC